MHFTYDHIHYVHRLLQSFHFLCVSFPRTLLFEQGATTSCDIKTSAKALNCNQKAEQRTIFKSQALGFIIYTLEANYDDFKVGIQLRHKRHVINSRLRPLQQF